MRPAGHSGSELRAELLERFAGGPERPWDDAEFNDLALRVFRYQYAAVPLFGRFCDGRGRTPETVCSWTEIPLVPTSAFKRFAFHAAGLPVQRVFRTSGTTGGTNGRGTHHVVDLKLYEASLLPNFRASVVPDTPEPVVLCLVPHPDQARDSSLAWMMGRIVDEMGATGSGFFLDLEAGVESGRLDRELRRLSEGTRPVLIAGTAFAFAMWLEEGGASVELPPDSVVMETGGFKGRTRELSRRELHGGLSERLGVPDARILGEYGMTELLSQYYEPRSEVARGRRGFQGPPWLRHRLLDPESLSAVEDDGIGILAHFDLANLFSVSGIVTEDLAVAVPGGFRLLGRSPGAQPRGCSLAVEEIIGHAAGDVNRA